MTDINKPAGDDASNLVGRKTYWDWPASPTFNQNDILILLMLILTFCLFVFVSFFLLCIFCLCCLRNRTIVRERTTIMCCTSRASAIYWADHSDVYGIYEYIIRSNFFLKRSHLLKNKKKGIFVHSTTTGQASQTWLSNWTWKQNFFRLPGSKRMN
jgi:hypothetical protein